MEQHKLNRAFWQMVSGVSNELEISDGALIKILKISENDLKNWQTNQEVPYEIDNPNKYILSYLDVYNCLTSFYVDKDAPKKWLNAINPSFNNKIPLDVMINEEDGIMKVLDYLRYLMNGP